MCKRPFWLGVLTLLSVVGVLSTATPAHAQVYSTVVINTPRGYTFITFPAQYAPTYVSGDPYPGIGLAPVYAPPRRLPPAQKPEAIPAPKATSQPAGASAQIDLRVPAAATIWLDGQRMKQTGSVRHLVSPPLDAGQTYHYALRLAWLENGREVTTTRRLTVRAGQRQSLLVLARADAGRSMVAGK